MGIKKTIKNKPNANYLLKEAEKAFLSKDFNKLLNLMEQGLKIEPNNTDYLTNKGVALRNLRREDEAIACYKKALEINPNLPNTLNNLGRIYTDRTQYHLGIPYIQKALEINPNHCDAMCNLIYCMFHQRKNFIKAIKLGEKALSVSKKYGMSELNKSNLINNLANICMRMGRLLESEKYYYEAMKLEPDNLLPHQNILLLSMYSDNFSPERAFEEHILYAKKITRTVKKKYDNHSNLKDKNKKIRLGYLSPDFRKHAVSYFVKKIFELHSEDKFEIYCYYNYPTDDEWTEKIRNCVDGWINIYQMTDEQVVEDIRKKEIDILIDLAGHTSRTRLQVFAMKPAPIQITWLGYPATTGIPEIDYRITDVYAEPEGMTEHLNVEKLLRLPEIFCCYSPKEGEFIPMDHPPCEDNGYITFGCFNNFAKVTQPVINLWGRILRALPEAKLLLEIDSIEDEEFAQDVLERFEKAGAKREQILLEPRKPQNQYVLYNKIDIALDPFPCNGGTTSFDTLWMGVPFVNLEGKWFVGRMGVTILTNAGLRELIAKDEEEYFNIAIKLATDREYLKSIRHNLRDRVEKSPLMDAKRFTAHFEKALKLVWENYYEGNKARHFNIPLCSKDEIDCIRERKLNKNLIIQKFVDPQKINEILSKNLESISDIEINFIIDYSKKLINSENLDIRLCNRISELLLKKQKNQEAYEFLKEILKFFPNDIIAIDHFGIACRRVKKFKEGIDNYEKILPQIENNFSCWNNMSFLYNEAKEYLKAERAARKAIEIDNNNFSGWLNLGSALLSLAKFNEAEEAFKKAIALNPSFFLSYNNLGNTYLNQRKYKDALFYFNESLKYNPNSAMVYANIALIHLNLENYNEAEKFSYKALEIESNHFVAISNLCNIYKNQGRLEDAEKIYKKYLYTFKHEPFFISNYLLTIIYKFGISPEELYKEHLIYEEFYGNKGIENKKFNNTKNPEKKLKIGFVSGDFWRHSVAYFVEPLFFNLNREKFEIFSYYTNHINDDFTEKLKRLSNKWIDAISLNDQNLYEKIINDEIDILIDLSGHTAKNRLTVFAMKPSPIQITWLGYPHSTGLKAIDYRITDNYAEPLGMTEHLNSEKLLRLPEIFCCYRPQRSEPVPIIGHPPYEENGFITFGCFNNFAKVTPPVVALWSRILNAIPNSKLLLEAAGIAEPNMKRDIENRFAEHGISEDRLIIVNREPKNQYVLYNKIDIALDPFPCNGGTTTCDALWMGVPVITLGNGKHFVSRMGISILTNVGLSNLIAKDEEEYFNIAIKLATDREYLKSIRHNLRERVEKSPLMDAKRFTKNFENALRKVWYDYCGVEFEDEEKVEILKLDSQSNNSKIVNYEVINRAKNAKLKEDYVELEKIFSEALNTNNYNSLTIFELGNLAVNFSRFYDALPLLKKAVDLEPKNLIYLVSFAQLLFRTNNINEALKTMWYAIRLNPELVDIKLMAVDMLFATKRYDEAITILIQIIQKKSDVIGAYLMLGRIFYEISLKQSALACFVRVIELDKNHQEALEYVKRIKRDLGIPEK